MVTLLFAITDPGRCAELTARLEGDGHDVVVTSDGILPEGVPGRSPVVLIADMAVALGSGFEACRTLRESADVTLLVLAGVGEGEAEELLALSRGADDYIRMPCSPEVLRARIGAALRRAERMGVRPGPVALRFGELTIDTGMRRAVVSGRPLHLTRIEFELLAALAEHHRRVLTRAEILHRVWGTWQGDDHVVEVHLSRLRRKIMAAGGPRIGEAVPGVGYRFGGEAA